MLVGIFALLIALGCFYMSYTMIQWSFKTRNWSTIQATVLEKKIEKHAQHSTKASYGLFVRYRYTVDNKHYENNKVFLVELAGGQTNHTSPESAQPFSDRIQNPCTVYVNPENPAESVIFREGVGMYIGIFCLGIIALLLAAGNIFSAFKG